MKVIVGGKKYAIQKMWEFITMGNQWTQYSNHILNFITINTNDDDNNNNHEFDIPNVYPFCLNDGNIIPKDTTRYIYCLVSTRNKDKIYIGEIVFVSTSDPI